MENIYIERDSDEFIARYGMKRVTYRIKIGGGGLDPSKHSMLAPPDDGTDAPTSSSFDLDELLQRILSNVKDCEAPFVKYKIGTKLSINRSVKTIYIEFKFPQDLTSELIAHRLMHLTQSNECIRIEDLRIEFTFFKIK